MFKSRCPSIIAIEFASVGDGTKSSDKYHKSDHYRCCVKESMILISF